VQQKLAYAVRHNVAVQHSKSK